MTSVLLVEFSKLENTTLINSYCERTYKEMTKIVSGEEVEIVIDNKQAVSIDLIHDDYVLLKESTANL